MKRWIASLSPRAELLLVLLAAFGTATVGGVLRAMGLRPEPTVIDTRLALGIVLYESVVLVGITVFLGVRDPIRIWWGARPGFAETGRGVALALASYLAYWTVAGCLLPFLPVGAATVLVTPVAWGALIALSLVNPVFEEGILLGYAARRLDELFGPRTAMAVTVLLRMFSHAYQGPYGVLNIALLGWIFGAWYLRHRRLWPVLVAHALLDFLPLAFPR